MTNVTEIPTATIPPLSSMDIDRFWGKVLITADDEKCWIWQCATRRRGYGRFFINITRGVKDKAYVATRVAYYLHNKIDPVGKPVLHTCDNPSCVNPKHLFVGTPKANADDMMKKGRGTMQFKGGESHPGAKLTYEIVRQIRLDYSNGLRRKDIVVKYSIDGATASRIVNNKAWKIESQIAE